MEQTIVMIPMYNPSTGAHNAVARVRNQGGYAVVEMRWTKSVDEKDIDILLFMDDGIKQVRNNRAPITGQILYGAAVITQSGHCICQGPVRNRKEGFEEALIKMRLLYPPTPVRQVKAQNEFIKAMDLKPAYTHPVVPSTPIKAPAQKTEAEPAKAAKPHSISGCEPNYVHAEAEPKRKWPKPGENAADAYPSGHIHLHPGTSAPQVHNDRPFTPPHPANAPQKSHAAALPQKMPAMPLTHFATTRETPSPPRIIKQPARGVQEQPYIPQKPAKPPKPPHIAQGRATVKSSPAQRENAELPQRIDNPFPRQFPGASWIRVQRLQEEGFYLEGRMRRGNEVATITAIPGEYSPVPPKNLQGFTRYIQTKNGGYWVRVQVN